MSNDNTESISAKLRRLSAKGGNCYCEAAGEYGIDCFDMQCSSCRRLLMTKIADEVDAEIHESRKDSSETIDNMAWKTVMLIAKGDDIPADKTRKIIDRYYLPRPLFEDGEPAQFGDMFVRDFGRDAKIDSLSYTKGNSDYVNINGYERHDFAHRLKRPNPQVLDADGVPIVVGDTVWNVFDDQKRTVIGFRGGKAHVESGPGIEFFEAGHELTHREPDSQERIDADVPKTVCKYFGASGKPCDECPIHGSKIGCSNEKMRDLLRRQRELDGRDA